MINSICDNFHMTSTAAIDPRLDAEGNLTGYLERSDHRYCPECGSSSMTPMSFDLQEAVR